MKDIIDLFGLASFAYITVATQPFLWLKDKLDITQWSKNSIRRFFGKMTSCALCTGFWTGVIIGVSSMVTTGDMTASAALYNIKYACALAIASEMIYVFIWSKNK